MNNSSEPLYRIVVLGDLSDDDFDLLLQDISERTRPFGLTMGHQVSISRPGDLTEPLDGAITTAALYCGSQAGDTDPALPDVIHAKIPIIPIITRTGGSISELIPEQLRHINALTINQSPADWSTVSTVLLEVLGLLPYQRQIFLSYRRAESRNAAIQLFHHLTDLQYEVFLDTHGLRAGEDFQPVLWHRLCESDVLLMLDTPGYFESRWTVAEYSRANVKGIWPLRIAWPTAEKDDRLQATHTIQLDDISFVGRTGRLKKATLNAISQMVETVRSRSVATRHANIVGHVHQAVSRISGSTLAMGDRRKIPIRLPTGTQLTVFPTIGIPSSETMHKATSAGDGTSVALAYDHLGINSSWMEHIEWLESHVDQVRLLRISEAAWTLADW